MKWFAGIRFAGIIILLGVKPLFGAATAIDEDAPWPRVRSTNGHTVTLHLPQVERWTSNSFVARAVVEVKPAGSKKELAGVIWFEADGRVDRSARVVTLERLEITKGRFPESTDNGTNALAIVRELFPGGVRTVSLDYLITALGFKEAAARQGAGGFRHDPPEIIWATNRTVLVLLDGRPVLRAVSGSSLRHVVNTPALLVQDPVAGRFYLQGAGRWFAASSVDGPWSLLQSPPAEVAPLAPVPPASAPPARGDEMLPRIIVRTAPAELLLTDSLPDFRPIRGTALQYAADSDSQLFFHTTERRAYLLISGRWFSAPALPGPWVYVPPRDLPSDFARIPPGSPQAVVLASVPDTPQAELALVANSVPTTATVKRREAKIDLKFDGSPKFSPIEGTTMRYAVNASLPVIQLGTNFFAVDDAVWFTADSADGPWQVAAEVPEAIYTIPPSSPVFYATYARVYDADEDTVEVGYSPGYTGAYQEDGTMVYGTGYDYEDWYGEEYYGWGGTWGYDYWYVPWYGWWVRRPWWNERGGLRAAVIENIYDRWQTRPGVTPHDRLAGAATKAPGRPATTGHPALYGRFAGATRAAALTLPVNAIALNPYSRPPSAVRPGEIPRGAQMLSAVRQTVGGGRDLYASPDGNVYRRQNDGWYRRQADGQWGFYAPAQGRMERNQIAVVRDAGPAVAGGGKRVSAAANAASLRQPLRVDRVPDAGGEANWADVAELDRQHYARALASMRRENVRPAGRAIRFSGRRR